MSKDALDGWRVDGKITATEQATQPGDVPILDSTGKIPDELINAVTKAQVGLGNVDNTADLNKPISTATQTALDGTVKNTGDESIAGVKSFSDNVEIGTTQGPRQLSIKGNLLIDGDITQSGSTYEAHAQQVYTTDDKIIMRDGATAGLVAGDSSGLTFKKYDGTNDGELSVDSSGTARVGDVGDLQPLATRDEAELMTNDQPVVWHADGLKMVTRALVAGDIPDLDAGKIKSGTIADARIPSGITRDAELTSALTLKQDKMTFDSSPVAGSDNPVKSGGIYDALMAIENKLPTPEVLEKLTTLVMPPVNCTTLSTKYRGNTSLTETPLINATGCTSLSRMFEGCVNLKTVKYIHTPNVTDMNKVFYGCSSLTSVPEMDTSSVTSMGAIFYGCSSLTSVPEMDTSSVANMKDMFRECSSLTSVPEMDTSSVTNMNEMFRECSSLTSVPEMDTSSVTSMGAMFYGCSSLTSVPEMDTSSVTSMVNMFRECSSLTIAPPLNVSGVSGSGLGGMFHSCSSLTSVTFTGGKVPPYVTGMFTSTPIASGQGSIYVPDNMVSSYKSGYGWSAHASVIKGISEKP